MRLWTIQTKAAWESLQTWNVLHGEQRFIWNGDPDETIAQAYRWMSEQMERRVGLRPFSGAYPIWAWVQWDGIHHAKPDLRVGGHLPTGADGVRLELEISQERVLLSDFSLWAWYALNYWYLPASANEERQFVQDCAQQGLDFYQTKPLPDAGLHKRLVGSWERIFDLGWTYKPVTSQCRENRRVQATFWTLNVEDVSAMHFFQAK